MNYNLPYGVTDADIDREFGGDPMCTCGRRWSDHAEDTKCPNKDCCDGGVGYEDSADDPARDCPDCKGKGIVPMATGDGLDDCWKFEEAEPDDGSDDAYDSWRDKRGE
jgi:hypothetical protein